MSLSGPGIKQASLEFGFVDNGSRRSSRGNGGFFYWFDRPLAVRAKESQEGERESSKSKTYER